MKILVVLVLLYCGCLADRERIDSHYADLLSDELIQKIQKRLQHWEEDDDSGSQNIASSGVGDAVTRSGKLSCHFSMQENTIIRTKDSLDAGATYQNAPVVSSREECRRECCKLGTKCNLAVYKHKQGDDACYLFDCGTPNVCNFSSHAGYVSMHVIRWMDDQQQPVDQHEDALAQLATTTTAVPVVSSQAHALQSEAQTPYNLHVVETTSNSIKLGWEGKESVYSLHIFQSGGAEDTYVSRKNEHEVDNLTPHTNYTLYVISYNNNGASSPSAQIVVTTGDDVPTSYPQTIVAPGRSSLNVTWTDLPASEAQGIVTQYKIVYRKHGTQTKKEVTIPGSANEFVINGLERGQSYDVRVEAGTRAGFANLPDGGWLTATVLPESQGKPCSKFQFACTSGSPRCIAIYDACDGMDHCSDGSDEKNCGDDDTNGHRGENGQQTGNKGKQPQLQPDETGSKSDTTSAGNIPSSTEKTPGVASSTKSPEEPSTHVDTPAPIAKKKAASDADVKIPGQLLEVGDEAKKSKLQSIRFNQTAVLVLALGLSITALLLIFAGCRLRTVKRRLRKGRPLNSNEADYLINGMYL